MKEKKPWHEQDDFWETFEPFLFSRQRIAEASREVEEIINLLEIRQDSKILDLGCGVGRHSLELARRGFQVTGVDRTKFYLAKASKQAKTKGLEIEFVNEDMRSFRRSTEFDVAINFFTTFGYFDDPGDDDRVIENVLASLKPGGKFLLEMLGKEILGRIFREKDWTEIDDTVVLEERKIGKSWEKIENRWVVCKDGLRSEHRFTLRLFSAAEISSLLKAHGFSKVNIYGSIQGDGYDEKAQRLVVVAQK